MDAKVKITLNHFVGGKRIAGTSGRFGDVYNPALGEVVKQVPLALSGGSPIGCRKCCERISSVG